MLAPSPVPRGRRPDDPGCRPWHQPAALPGAAGGVLGLPAGTAGALLAWSLGGAHLTGLVFAAVAAGGVALLTTAPGALAAAVQCWAVYDGFVVNRFGRLAGTRSELVALGVVCLVALAVRIAAASWKAEAASLHARRYAAPCEPPEPGNGPARRWRRVSAAD